MPDPREEATLARTDAEEVAHLGWVAERVHDLFFFAWCHHRSLRGKWPGSFADKSIQAAYEGLDRLQQASLRAKIAAREPPASSRPAALWETA